MPRVNKKALAKFIWDIGQVIMEIKQVREIEKVICDDGDKLWA